MLFPKLLSQNFTPLQHNSQI